jgi:hypothetical protein
MPSDHQDLAEPAYPNRPGTKSEAKSESKFDDEDSGAKGGGQSFDENELLMAVAVSAEKGLFGGGSELMSFVEENASSWDEALAGQRDGSGSPMKQMGTWKQLHDGYLEIMETWLEAAVAKAGGSISQFMKDSKAALEGGDGFLFEDENHAEFLQSIQALEDFQAFHQMMMQHAGRLQAKADRK